MFRALVRPRRLALLAATALLCRLAFPISFGKTELPGAWLEPLAFVCLVPALVAIRGLRPLGAGVAGFLCGLVFFIASLGWVTNGMAQFTPLPWILCVLMMLVLTSLCAFCWALAFFLVRLFSEKNGWAVGLTFGPVWMATELFRNYFVTGLPWAGLGYSQARTLWLAQLASLGGVYGIALLAAFVNATLYEALRARVWKERAFPRAQLVAAGLLLLGALAYGAWRVKAWNDRAAGLPRLQVAVVQGNIDQRLKLVQDASRAVILASYNPATAEADGAGADLIVWPESSFPEAFKKGEPTTLAGHGLSQRRYGGALLVGAESYDPSDKKSENVAYLVAPDLRVAKTYTKNHLVLFGEYVPSFVEKALAFQGLTGRYKPGDSLEPVEVALKGQPGSQAKVGIEICFDAVFPEISREYARRGAQVLVNMTNDAWWGFSSAPFQFLRIVQMRAIETGRPVARAANTGTSGFVDPVGRVSQATELGLVESDEAWADVSLKVPALWRAAPLPLSTERTPYVVIGDVPAYLASLFCLVGAVLAVKKRKAVPRGSLGI